MGGNPQYAAGKTDEQQIDKEKIKEQDLIDPHGGDGHIN